MNLDVTGGEVDHECSASEDVATDQNIMRIPEGGKADHFGSNLTCLGNANAQIIDKGVDLVLTRRVRAPNIVVHRTKQFHEAWADGADACPGINLGKRKMQFCIFFAADTDFDGRPVLEQIVDCLKALDLDPSTQLFVTHDPVPRFNPRIRFVTDGVEA